MRISCLPSHFRTSLFAAILYFCAPTSARAQAPYLYASIPSASTSQVAAFSVDILRRSDRSVGLTIPRIPTVLGGDENIGYMCCNPIALWAGLVRRQIQKSSVENIADLGACIP